MPEEHKNQVRFLDPAPLFRGSIPRGDTIRIKMNSTANTDDTNIVSKDPEIQRWFELVVLKDEYYDFLDDMNIDTQSQNNQGE